MDEIISYKMCAVKVRNAKLRNYLKVIDNKSIIVYIEMMNKVLLQVEKKNINDY
jgi:hypothetical protein